MSGVPRTAWLAKIRLHPIKGLDPVSVPEARIGANGGLDLDRVWVLFSVNGAWINGKRTTAIHHIRAKYDPGVSMVTLMVSGDAAKNNKLSPTSFAFPSDYERAASWFSEYFEQTVIVRHVPEGIPDDGLATGPTIVSTASLRSVCDLFPGVEVNEARERFRTTLEIDGVPAFWEDQLFSKEENYPVRFKIGEVAFEGSNPCVRCPVPPRNPAPAKISSASRKSSAKCAAIPCLHHRPPSASTIFIASLPTPASRPRNKANCYALATAWCCKK